MKRIGIFGSSFNPIHIGHLIIAEQARIRLELDEILFIPTYSPYHKKVDVLDFSVRYNMTKESIKDNNYFKLSDIEKKLDGNSYSYNLLKLLKSKEEANYYFIMGSDSFNNLDTWYRYKDFLSLVNLVVFERPGYFIDEKKLVKYKNLADIYYYNDVQIQVSSTFIRKEIKRELYPKYLLKEETINFIKENKLWQ